MKRHDDWHVTDDIAHERGEGDPFAAAVRATRMPMVITDPRVDDNPIIFCNEAFQTLTGYDRDEIIGRNCRFLQGPDTDKAAVARVAAAIAAGTDIEVDLLNYRKDGSTFWNALYISPVRNRAGDIEFFFASQLNVTERIEAKEAVEEQKAQVEEQKAQVEREVERRTADLQAALEAKTLLLHEVDHRVKNNLTMIGSLIRLQARTIGDPAVGAKLEAMLERVDALATVHRRLYQSEDITRFDVGAFAKNLASDVVGSSGRDNIEIRTKVDAIEVPSEHAAALGLVLNEVLTNAIKHGYADGRPGVLSVTATQQDGKAVITIADDGPGISGEMSNDRLGRALIQRLSRQVGAETVWTPANPGACVTVRFPVENGR